MNVLLELMKKHKERYPSNCPLVREVSYFNFLMKGMVRIMDSTFEDEESLKVYANHPAHVAVADGKVRPHTIIRSCMDFEI